MDLELENIRPVIMSYRIEIQFGAYDIVQVYLRNKQSAFVIQRAGDDLSHGGNDHASAPADQLR